jgi:hypothetical protein
MIIWLASYPKSGNTWIRLFLDKLLNNNENIDINNIKSIQFPQKFHFDGLVKDTNNLKETSVNYIVAQDKINLDNKIKFFKTHSANWKAYNTSFTNFENTLGVIHIVRDPRNIVTSVLNHFSKESYPEAMKFMNNSAQQIWDNKNESEKFLTLISSWSNHYNSWKKFKKNNLLISYERLLNEPEKEFNKICNLLSKITNLSFKKNQILEAIDKCKFTNLQKLETEKGFVEAVSDKNGNVKKFFNLGPNNNWEKLLDPEIKSEIEKLFGNEMRDLGYIN